MFISCLIAVARISNTMLKKKKKVVRMGVLALFLNLEKKFSDLLTEYDVSGGFFTNGLSYFEMWSLCTHFDESFIITEC